MEGDVTPSDLSTDRNQFGELKRHEIKRMDILTRRLLVESNNSPNLRYTIYYTCRDKCICESLNI